MVNNYQKVKYYYAVRNRLINDGKIAFSSFFGVFLQRRQSHYYLNSNKFQRPGQPHFLVKASGQKAHGQNYGERSSGEVKAASLFWGEEI
jgi:hypothetical protein